MMLHFACLQRAAQRERGISVRLTCRDGVAEHLPDVRAPGCCSTKGTTCLDLAKDCQHLRGIHFTDGHGTDVRGYVTLQVTREVLAVHASPLLATLLHELCGHSVKGVRIAGSCNQLLRALCM